MGSQQGPHQSMNIATGLYVSDNLRTVAQSLNLQLGHLIHRRLNVFGFSLSISTLSSQPFPLFPSGNCLSVIAKRVQDLEVLIRFFSQHYFFSNRTFVTAAFLLAASWRFARSSSSVAWIWLFMTSSRHCAPMRRSFILSVLKTSLVTYPSVCSRQVETVSFPAHGKKSLAYLPTESRLFS